MKSFIKKAVTVFIISSGLPGLLIAGNGPGTSGFEFLNIPIGARETATGSGTATVRGPNSFWWNPAGLAYTERLCVSLMYNKWFEGISQQRAGVTFPIPVMDRSVGAVNVSMLSVTGIDGYDWYNVATGDLQAKDYYFAYSQAKAFTDMIMGGITIKGIVEQLDDESAFAGAVDGGGLVNPAEGVWAALGFRNLGVSGKFIEEKPPLPLTFYAGGGLLLNKFILLSTDINYLDQELKYGGGVELNLWDILFMRGGWNNFADEGQNFFLGAGWKWKDMVLDYVYAPYGKLGTTQRIDINIYFGKPPLVESIYRKAQRLYKDRKYKQAWIEFNKVDTLQPGYKKVKSWLEKASELMPAGD